MKQQQQKKLKIRLTKSNRRNKKHWKKLKIFPCWFCQFYFSKIHKHQIDCIYFNGLTILFVSFHYLTTHCEYNTFYCYHHITSVFWYLQKIYFSLCNVFFLFVNLAHCRFMYVCMFLLRLNWSTNKKKIHLFFVDTIVHRKCFCLHSGLFFSFNLLLSA